MQNAQVRTSNLRDALQNPLWLADTEMSIFRSLLMSSFITQLVYTSSQSTMPYWTAISVTTADTVLHGVPSSDEKLTAFCLSVSMLLTFCLRC